MLCALVFLCWYIICVCCAYDMLLVFMRCVYVCVFLCWYFICVCCACDMLRVFRVHEVCVCVSVFGDGIRDTCVLCIRHVTSVSCS